MTLSWPSAARAVPPLTGASKNSSLRSDSRVCTRRTNDGATVLHSMTSAPGASASAAPCGPKRTASACSPLRTMIISASASVAASAGEVAASPPSWTNAATASSEMSYPATVNPARRQERAMPDPIAPRPTKPIRWTDWVVIVPTPHLEWQPEAGRDCRRRCFRARPRQRGLWPRSRGSFGES